MVGRIKAAARRVVKSSKAIIGNAEDFTEKFEKNAFKPDVEQHFIQEFFYVTNMTDGRRLKLSQWHTQGLQY